MRGSGTDRLYEGGVRHIQRSGAKKKREGGTADINLLMHMDETHSRRALETLQLETNYIHSI
jgi:hypothetical protein